MADMTIQMILSLVDQITAPARGVMNSLHQIERAGEQVGQAGMAWSSQQITAIDTRRQALRGEAMEIAGLGFALYQSLRPAIEFETAMAGVRRVVEFDTPDQIGLLHQDILELTTSGAIPMAAEGIAAIIEAAGQAGIVDSALPDAQQRAELIEFARDAAQMGIAFDISAEQAGSAMATWRARMRLSAEDTAVLGDAINHLSNNMSASAPDILNVIGRQGAVAQTAGLVREEIAALSAAFVAAAPSPEIAATGMQNFLLALTAGEAMTERQTAVLSQLGFEAETLAQVMQDDAQGSIMSVLEALSQLDAAGQSAALSQLFGRESIDAIAPMLTNLDLLRDAFGLVEDQAGFSGSMMEEYGSQAGTTANQIRNLLNFLSALSITAGTILLPEINALVASLTPMLARVTEWAAAHPELITMIVRLGVGLLALKAGVAIVSFAFLSVLRPILSIVYGFSWLLSAGARILGFLRGLPIVLGLVRGAFVLVTGAARALAVALISNPIGLIIAAIAAAAYLIYANWDKIGPYFQAVWDYVVGIFQRARDFLTSTIDGLTGFDWSSLLSLEGLVAAWSGISTFAATSFGILWDLLSPLSWAGLVTSEDLATAWASVTEFVGTVATTLWDGITGIDWGAMLGLNLLLTAWQSVGAFLRAIGETLWDGFQVIAWLALIGLEALRAAWAGVLGFFAEFTWSAILPDWDWLDIIPDMPDLRSLMPEMPDWNTLFGHDDQPAQIVDPQTLLEAARAASELETAFPLISAAADAVLIAVVAAITQSDAALQATDFTAQGARIALSVATGIRSQIGEVRAASAEMAQAIRDALPSGATVNVALSGGGAGPVQARAGGGSYHPGMRLVGEQGPELDYMSHGGYIAHHGQLMEMLGIAQRAHSIARSTRTLSVSASQTPIRIASAQAAGPARGPQAPLVGSLTVNARTAEDANAIARAVRTELERVENRRRGDLHDGVDY